MNTKDIAYGYAIGYNDGLNKGKHSDEEWTPPANWIEVPEPNDYEIYILIDIVDVSTSNNSNFSFYLSRPGDQHTGIGSLTINWGDGIIETWSGSENGESWGSGTHNYNNVGQYLIKIITTANSCFLQTVINGGYSKALIMKLGAEIIVTDDSISGKTNSTQRAFYEQRKLHYVKMNGKCGLPRDKGFWGCTSLRKIDISILPETIPPYTFANCYNLKSFDFSKVTEISNEGLQGSQFKQINLPKCTSIGDYGLSYNSTLKKITAPLCESVGKQCFLDNYSLEEVVFSTNCTYGQNCFENCNSLIPRPDGSIL